MSTKRGGLMYLLASTAVPALCQSETLVDPRTAYPTAGLVVPSDTDSPWPHLQRGMPGVDCGETSYVGNERLVGRKALITGGDSGIGRAVAIAYAREGANVTINYLPEEEPDAEDVAAVLAEDGLAINRVPGDLLNETFCAELVTEAHALMGGLDIVVNNAGFIPKAVGPDIRGIDNYTTASFDRVLRSNLYAPFFIIRAAVPLMPPGSSILFTTSGTAVNPLPYGPDYSASKAGLNAFMLGLSRQLVSRGIRVNAVAAGLLFSPFLITEGYNTTELEATIESQPASRVEQPVEMAYVYVSVVNENATYSTGSVWGATSGLGL